MGGIANVFVKGENGVSMIVASRPTGEGNPVDLSDVDEWKSGESDIDMFLDYLRRQKDGVVMPDHLPCSSELSMNLSSDSVELEKVPELV